FAAVGLSVVFLDVAAYTANGTQTLNSSGDAANPFKALVVYDPGITGAPKNIADKVASNLQTKGYQVVLAGIKSSAATIDTVQYQVIVVGGPVYGGNAAVSVKSYLSSLKPAYGAKIGVFGVGSFGTENDKLAPLPAGSSVSIKETFKISTSQNATAESAEFVTQLLS
ncbi:MAG: hypothetical protein ABSD92_13195, partial [Candidatus Bathyarchaeia archaeon]